VREHARNHWHLRRELVETSLQVFPLHDERALEIGDHRFHERGKAWSAGSARPVSSRSGAAWTGAGWPNG
jgi:hypothetical protein